MSSDDAVQGWELCAVWVPESDTNGRLELTLSNHSSDSIRNARLGYTSQLHTLSEDSIVGGQLVLSDGGYHEIIPPEGYRLDAGRAWTVVLSDLNFKPAHANDGPITAFVVSDAGLFDSVRVRAFVPKGSVGLAVEDAASSVGAEDTGADTSGAEIGLIPYPNTVQLSSDTAQTPAGLILSSGCSDTALRQVRAVEALRSRLFEEEPAIFRSSGSQPSGLGMIVHVHEKAVDDQAESYDIQFHANSIDITAGQPVGMFYACISLCQIIRAARLHPDQFVFPAPGSRITDYPQYGWRGAHLDVSRRFYPTKEVCTFIATIAWFKMNRFHWHLTDDEAWRLEINAFPELVDTSSVRGIGQAIPLQLHDDIEGHRGHYSQSDVAEVVRFAANLQVEIMPEIDMPAHATAALRALPWLVDTVEKPRSYVSVQGFYNNALNPALPATSRFVNTVIDELVTLFPGSVIHVGGDEVPENAWQSSRSALAMAAAKGLPSTTDLQGIFLHSVHQRLLDHSRVMGVWDDGVSVDLKPDNTLVFVWRDASHASQLAAWGHDIIMTPAQFSYLDMALSADWNEPGASWAGSVSRPDSYEYDVAVSGELNSKLRGVQCGIWSEHMASKAVFDYLVYSRLPGICESAWTLPRNKSWSRFSKISAGTVSQSGE